MEDPHASIVRRMRHRCLRDACGKGRSLAMTLSLRSVRSLLASFCRYTGLCKAWVVAALIAVPLLATPGFAQTTISGTVFAPNAVDPLSHVLVYITTGTVAPFTAGAACPGPNCLTASTAVPANAIVSTYTAVDGTFTLSDVPENTTYTLVIQAGKWRRQFSEPVVSSPLSGLVLDMPTTHTEGDIPLIAIATGSADAVECVLRDVGLADTEFTDDNGISGGRIHLYLGNHAAGAEINASTPSQTVLMGNTTTLNGYDMVMFPCQGVVVAESAANIDNLLGYTSSGGRVFATHDSRGWINTGTTVASGPFAGETFAGVANWDNGQAAPPDGTATINTSFTDGATLAQWLQNAGDSAGGTLGQVAISTVRHDIDGVFAPTQTWLTLNSDNVIMQFTFNTPVGAAAAGQYGRVLFNEYHVENVSTDTGTIFPAECGVSPHNPVLPAAMSAQEKMLEYALFDLSNFVTPIIVPTVSIGITTEPSDSIFMEGDTTDTITLDVTDTSGTVALDNSVVLTAVLPTGLTATAMTDTAGAWLCTVGTLTCTTTGIAAGASDSVSITVSVAANATGGAASTTPTVSAKVSSPTFSTNVTAPLTITLQRHAAATWATPAAIADGTPLSGTELNAVGNTAGTYVYTPPAGTVLSPGSHTLSVTFTPSDQVTFPGTATMAVTLVVNSAVAATASAPAATNFGSLPIASASGSQSVAFTFLTPGVVGSAVVVTQGATGLDFADATSGTCDTNGTSFVYGTGATCTVNVIFTPGYPGTRYGAVLLEDESGNILATAYLYGTGTGPQANFLPGTETPAVIATIAKPQGLALDGNGNLYTADFTNHAVYQTTPLGVTTKVLDLSTVVGLPGTPEALAVDGAGNLYIGDSINNEVWQATPSGSGYLLNPSPVASGLSSSGGVAVDQYGNVYIADTNNNRILLETRQTNGSYVQTVIVAAATPILGTALNTPFDVAVDTNGDVFISDTLNDRVLKESFSGGTYTPSLVAGGLDWPTQLVVDGEGNVYFANYGHSSASNSHVYKETLAGGSYVQAVVPTSLTASNVWGVAVAGNGNVYLSDVTDVRVIEEKFATPPSLSFAPTNVGSTSSDSPQAVTLENVGNAALALTASGLIAPHDFSQVAGSGSPTDCADSATVAAGTSCDLSIKFAPTIGGNPLSESFVLTDNSLNASPATQDIPLRGIGLGGSLTLSPSGSTLATGAIGVLYSGVTFTASGGTGPYSFSYVGTLPPGLILSSGGVLSGTPTTAGAYSFTIITTDANSVIGSQAYSLVIGQATSTAAVASSANPALAQSAVTFTATISAAAGTPTGTVNFLDGTTVLGQGTLSGGVATLTTSSLAVGSHTITAVYSGSTNFVASTSGPLTEAVLNFTLSPGPGSGGSGPVTSQTVAPGGVATYPLDIVPTAGTIFPTPVTLTVTGMPPGATAIIAPSSWTALTPTSWSFPPNTPLNQLSLTVQLPAALARLDRQDLTHRGLPPLIWGTLLLPFAGGLRRSGKRRGRTISLLLLLASMGAMVGLSSCATSGFFAPTSQQQTYIITVTATSGTLSHSTTLTLTVK
jgi:hypothetical protein